MTEQNGGENNFLEAAQRKLIDVRITRVPPPPIDDVTFFIDQPWRSRRTTAASLLTN